MASDPASLEASIHALLADTLGKIPTGRFPLSEMSRQLVVEIRAATKRFESGASYAPDQYTFSMHPLDVALVLEHAPSIQLELGERLQEALSANGLLLVRAPRVTMATDPTVDRGEVRTIAWRSSAPLTVAPSNKPVSGQRGEREAVGAFLIVEGRRHLPLNKPLIRIGRRLDNDLVLADLHVSRFHAELHLREGRYVVVDTASTAGTFVNGERVREQALSAGDVITIAGTNLIYGEDPSGPPAVTPPYTPPGVPRSDRDTITPLDLKTIRREDDQE
jgi:hypothetical protein